MSRFMQVLMAQGGGGVPAYAVIEGYTTRNTTDPDNPYLEYNVKVYKNADKSDTPTIMPMETFRSVYEPLGWDGIYGVGPNNNVFDSIDSQKAVKRIGCEKLNSLSWWQSSGEQGTICFKAIISKAISSPYGDKRHNILSNKYETSSSYAAYSPFIGDKCLIIAGNYPNATVVVQDYAYTSCSDFVNSLSYDDVLYYELTDEEKQEIPI